MGWLVLVVVIVWVVYQMDQETQRAREQERRTQQHKRTNSNWTRPINGGTSANGPWQELREQVFARDKHKCTSCGSGQNLTVDHIQELSLDGDNSIANLRTLCAVCHETRHNRRFLDRAFDADPGYGSNQKHNAKIKALNDAMKSSKGIGIKYIDREGLYSERVIYPKRVYKMRYVYVDAFCELDKADRMFRLSRIRISKGRLNFYDNPTNSYTSSPWQGPQPRFK